MTQSRDTSPAQAMDGRPRAITMLTPIKPLGSVLTRLMFAGARSLPRCMGIRPLKTIYFTRWSILTSIPYNGTPQVRDRLVHPQLFWETDYTGMTEPYIEMFTYVIGPQINRTWRTSYGFPGTRSVGNLRQYIQHLTLPISYYYTAYPTATVRMILSALAVAKEHTFLREAARTTSPEEFGIVYRGFLARRQGDL